MVSVTVEEARVELPSLIQRAAAGEDVLISEHGKPVAKLVSVPIENSQPLKPRVPGSMRGKIWIADDFDAPLPPDLQAAFEGEEIE
ncbi:MAG: type II toxin-antitoxin system Phd/YefM family antitoxin [Chloroflexi bacterium]|nr:type II toxin-antitoxin system Phd/YefM family antitoxin [Chloroflexota bacterium]